MVWGQLTDPVKVQKVRTLDISGNPQLKTIPLEVHGLVNLKSLNVARCSIQRLHNLEMLTRLTMLRLDRNDLEETTVGGLPLSITLLSIRDNHFRSIPPSIFLLERLVFLDLSGNRLDQIDGIESLRTVQELLLDENNLPELPEAIGELINLQFLSVKSNQLGVRARSRDGQSIPAAIFENSSLERLDLAGNPLRQKEIMSFDGVNTFLARRKASKDKLIQGGGMLDNSLFGLN